MRRKIDLNSRIYRFQNGIKLINQSPSPLSSLEGLYATTHTVASILALPFNFYFLNLQGKTELMNEECALICGFDSVEKSIGKSLFDVSEQKSAKNLIDNCLDVINSQAVKVFEEENLRKDGLGLDFLTIKCPWYDTGTTIIGVFGCSIVLGKHKLASSLSEIIELGLFNTMQLSAKQDQPLSSFNMKQSYLSRREMECLQLTIKGYTAKRIARELKISHRTVEEYLINIRMKMGATSKAELIEMTIERFLPINLI